MSQKGIYYLAIIASVFAAVAIFIYAIHEGSKDDAVRGGALPVLVSFLLLFLRRNYSEQSFDELKRAIPGIAAKLDGFAQTQTLPTFTQPETSQLLLAILSRMNIEASERKLQDAALFVASVVGTIQLAFGDYFFKLIHG